MNWEIFLEGCNTALLLFIIYNQLTITYTARNLSDVSFGGL